MFTNMDTDNSGSITYEELKTGLVRLGSKLTEAEVKQLMDAVRQDICTYKSVCVCVQCSSAITYLTSILSG